MLEIKRRSLERNPILILTTRKATCTTWQIMLFNLVLKGHVVRSLHQISIAYLEYTECIQNLRSKFQYKVVVFLFQFYFLSDGKINVMPSKTVYFMIVQAAESTGFHSLLKCRRFVPTIASTPDNWMKTRERNGQMRTRCWLQTLRNVWKKATFISMNFNSSPNAF
jgi:hypothetical protein